MSNTKKGYASPKLKRWGTVADLTQNGPTNPGMDAMGGSGSGQGGGPGRPGRGRR